MLLFFHKIKHRLYSIAYLCLVLFVLLYIGVHSFSKQQAETAKRIKRSTALLTEIKSLGQAFNEMRLWQKSIVLDRSPDDQFKFSEAEKQFKNILTSIQSSDDTQHLHDELDSLAQKVTIFSSHFKNIIQLNTQKRLIETKFLSNYESVEAASLRHKEESLLRKVFLISRFQRNYERDPRNSANKALLLAIHSTANSVRRLNVPDHKIYGYLERLENLQEQIHNISKEIRTEEDILRESSIRLSDVLLKITDLVEKETGSELDQTEMQLDQLRNNFLIIVSVAGGISFALILYIARNLSIPLTNMLQVIKRVEKGDHKARCELHGNNKDELFKLLKSLNKMLDSMDLSRLKMLDYQDELKKKVDELESTYEQIRLESDEKVKTLIEKQELEEKLRHSNKMEAIGTLAGGIAHDFNNILGAILGYSELTLLKGNLSHEDRTRLTAILTAAERAKDLVSQILMFSRKEHPKKIAVNIYNAVTEALDLARKTTPSNINFELDLQPDIGCVNADLTQLHQIILNLCSNAYHAMGKQAGTISISLRRKTVGIDDASGFDLPAGEYACLSVVDTGKGIAPYKLERIFDPFFTTKEVGAGTGLGLSVVHGIIKSHGGGITVESEIGNGTSFTILLPLSAEDTPDSTQDNKRDLNGTGEILLVDDEPSLLDIGKEMLGALGYTVTTENNPLNAIKLIKNGIHFDLVLTDQTMPEMTGDQLALEILSLKPNLPVILYTGHSDLIDKESALALGISAYLLKPLRMGELGEVLKSVLAK